MNEIYNVDESILLDKNVKYSNTLNPIAWEKNTLRQHVRETLLDIADAFIEFLNLPNLEETDSVLTGSTANYHWTEFSDFDIHVIVDYDKIAQKDVTVELFTAKKEVWNTAHNIQIKGYTVELYVEDTATPPISQGVFSLLNNEWLRVPSYHKPSINDAAIEAKVLDLMLTIDTLVDSNSDDVSAYTTLTEKIRKMRKSGLAEHGEFSTENLAFKVLRNEGYISKLYTARREAVDKSLTIE